MRREQCSAASRRACIWLRAADHRRGTARIMMMAIGTAPDIALSGTGERLIKQVSTSTHAVMATSSSVGAETCRQRRFRQKQYVFSAAFFISHDGVASRRDAGMAGCHGELVSR